SMTHGPAMRTSDPSPIVTPSAMRTGATNLPSGPDRRDVGRDALQAHLSLVGGLDEPREERMRAQRLRLELRMELHGDIPGVARQLDDLDELAVERSAHDLQAAIEQRL